MNDSRPIRMRDVAKVAGVSHQTVSRVLNTPDLVQQQTRDRVLEVIEMLNYRPHAAARALSVRRSGTIGVLDSGSQIHGQAIMLQTVETAARRHGYATSVAAVAEGTASVIKEAFQHLLDMGVEGIVIMGNTAQLASAAERVSSSVPVVMVTSSTPEHSTVLRVGVDSAGGARAVVRHLAARGRTRIRHIAGPHGWLDAQAREAGWRAELAHHGLPALDPVEGDWLPSAGYRAANELIARGDIDAIFAANDHMAMGALRAIFDAGLRVPDDIAVAGFDDLIGTGFLTPSLTTVHQPFEEVGEVCMANLLAAIAGETVNNVLLDAKLVIRESTGVHSQEGLEHQNHRRI